MASAFIRQLARTSRLTRSPLTSSRVATRTTPYFSQIARASTTATDGAKSTPAADKSATQDSEFKVSSEAPAREAEESGPLDEHTDWSKSYHGLSAQPFPKEVAEVLLAPIDPQDVEIKPGACHCSRCDSSF